MVERNKPLIALKSTALILIGCLAASQAFAGIHEVLFAPSSKQDYQRNKGYLAILSKEHGIPMESAVIGTLTVRASLRSDVLRAARKEAWTRGGDALYSPQIGEVKVKRMRYGQEVLRREKQVKALVLRYDSREKVDSLLVGRLLRRGIESR